MSYIFLLSTVGVYNDTGVGPTGKSPDVRGLQANARNVDIRCGAYCLYVCLKSLDYDVQSFDELEERLGPPSRMGYSIHQLAEVAKSYGAHAEGVRTTLRELKRRRQKFTCIALIQSEHYVCIYAIDGKDVEIIDPPKAAASNDEVLAAIWDGTALLIAREPLEIRGTSSLYWQLTVLTGIGAILITCFRTWKKSREHIKA